MLIKPVLEYGCEAFISAAPVHKQKLDRIQYVALKICTGALYGTALSKLQVECGEPPLHLRRNYLCNLYCIKLNIHSSHPNKYLLQDCWQKHYFADKWARSLHHTPFEGRWNQTSIKISLLHNPFPYWHYTEPNISKEIFNSTKNIKDNNEKGLIATEIINTVWGNSLHIYTDGSLDPRTNAVGSSMYVPYFKYSKSVKLENGASIFTAELFAILLSLEWIEVQPIYTCIFSDCLSAIQAISQFNPKNKFVCDIRHILISIQQQANRVVFEWIPGHCGIKGNEMADQIAKQASKKHKIDTILPQTISEAKHLLNNNVKQLWQSEWNETKDSTLKIIQPIVSLHIKPWDVPHWQEIWFHRLRLGMLHNLNSYKHKIGKHPNGLCDICKSYDNVSHFLIFCTKYNESRSKLQRALKYTQEQMTVKNLLTSKTNFAHILQFIRETSTKL